MGEIELVELQKGDYTMASELASLARTNSLTTYHIE